MPRTIPPWLQAEYDRIGREREAAGREVERMYRWELFRACGEMIGWTVLGLIVAGIGFSVTGYNIGIVFVYSGMLINVTGLSVALWGAYRRGVARGDW